MKITIEQLYRRIRVMKGQSFTLLVGIDGCGGSGKSTLAQSLKERSPDEITLVHKDDFYKPGAERQGNEDSREIGEDFDWRRLRDQVLQPLRQNREAHYRRYDWNQDALAEWIKVPSGGMVVVEGVYALRKELAGMYDYKIWVETPYHERLARGVDRDGEDMRQTWENVWMPAEQHYVETEKPYERADIRLDGSGKAAGSHIQEWSVLGERTW